MRHPSVAVALAAYNGVQWIDEQLDSILNQRDVDVTIFVSVDRSNDGSEAHILARSKLDRRIILLPDNGPYGGAACNFYRLIRDIDFCLFDYLALSDQDDIWFTDKLSCAITLMHNKKVSAYSSNAIAFWSQGRKKLINKAQPQTQWDFLFEAAGPGCSYVFAANMALKLQSLIRENWQKVSGITLHDWLFYAYVRSTSQQWYIDPVPRLLYRQHGQNQMGANTSYRSALKRLAMINSGWYRKQSRSIALLCGLSESLFVQYAFGGHWWSRFYILMHLAQTRRLCRDRLLLGFCCLLNIY